MFLLKTNKIK